MAEQAELLRERIAPSDGPDDRVGLRAQPLHSLQLVPQGRRVRGDLREQGAEVLGHAARQPTDRVGLLAGPGPLLQLAPRVALLALGHVAHRLHAQGPALLLELGERHLGDELRAVPAAMALADRDRARRALRRAAAEIVRRGPQDLLGRVAVQLHRGLVGLRHQARGVVVENDGFGGGVDQPPVAHLAFHQALEERAARAPELALLHRALHLEAERREIGDWFGQVVERPDLHRLDGRLHARIAGNEDDLDLRLHQLELPREIQAGVGAEVLVHQRDLDLGAAGVLHGAGGGVRGDDLAVGIVEQAGQDLDHDPLVVDQQDAGLSHRIRIRPTAARADSSTRWSDRRAEGRACAERGTHIGAAGPAANRSRRRRRTIVIRGTNVQGTDETFTYRLRVYQARRRLLKPASQVATGGGGDPRRRVVRRCLFLLRIAAWRAGGPHHKVTIAFPLRWPASIVSCAAAISEMGKRRAIEWRSRPRARWAVRSRTAARCPSGAPRYTSRKRMVAFLSSNERQGR